MIFKKSKLEIIIWLLGIIIIIILGFRLIDAVPKYKNNTRAGHMTIYVNDVRCNVKCDLDSLNVTLKESNFADNEVDLVFLPWRTDGSPDWRLREESEDIFTIEKSYFWDGFFPFKTDVRRLTIGVNNDELSNSFQIVYKDYMGKEHFLNIVYK